MTLSEYLKEQDLMPAEFAARIKVSRVSVVRYCNGSRRPDWKTLERIVEETGGAVGAEDFFARTAA